MRKRGFGLDSVLMEQASAYNGCALLSLSRQCLLVIAFDARHYVIRSLKRDAVEIVSSRLDFIPHFLDRIHTGIGLYEYRMEVPEMPPCNMAHRWGVTWNSIYIWWLHPDWSQYRRFQEPPAAVSVY